MVEDLELEGLKHAAASSSPLTPADPRNSPAAGGLECHPENFDTYAAILNYTQKCDALMAFYYMDNDKLLKVGFLT